MYIITRILAIITTIIIIIMTILMVGKHSTREEKSMALVANYKNRRPERQSRGPGVCCHLHCLLHLHHHLHHHNLLLLFIICIIIFFSFVFILITAIVCNHLLGGIIYTIQNLPKQKHLLFALQPTTAWSISVQAELELQVIEMLARTKTFQLQRLLSIALLCLRCYLALAHLGYKDQVHGPAYVGLY